MKTIIIVVAFVFAIFGFLFAKSPEWVENRPINSDFYIGIGSSLKIKGSNDYIEKAKSEALKNLASEITISISGEIVSDMIEKSGLLEEEIRSTISTSTQADLEGYEIIDEWQDKKQYYVYYRMSKDLYLQQKQYKIDKAVSLSLDLFSRAKNSEKNNEYDKALSFYLQALKPLDKFIGEPLKTDYRGRSIYLSNEIYSSLQNLLSNIQLSAENSKIAAKRNVAVKLPLKAKAVIADSELPIANLPVKFSFTRGKGDLQKEAMTNLSGIVSCRIVMLKSNDKMQFVKAELDLEKLMDLENTSFVYKNILESYPIPSTKFILAVSGLSFAIESKEQNLGKDMIILQVEPKLKEALSEKGYSFADDFSSADFFIEITANSREGSEMYGMYSSFVDLSVSVTDMNSGEEIYKNVYSNVSGQGLDYEKAGLKAFREVSDKFLLDFISVVEIKIK